MMNTPPTSINVPSATNTMSPTNQASSRPFPQQPYQAPAQARFAYCSPEEAGQRLLSMINDVLPLVDQDPELLTVMHDVTRLMCDYE